jgi:hypothetical protein
MPFDPRLPNSGSFPFRAGVTLIISAPEVNEFGYAGKSQVRYAVKKGFCGTDATQREDRQRQFQMEMGFANGDTDDPNHFQANFGLIHQGL